MIIPKDVPAATFYEHVGRKAINLAQACRDYSDALNGRLLDRYDVGAAYNDIERCLEDLHAISTLALDL